MSFRSTTGRKFTRSVFAVLTSVMLSGCQTSTHSDNQPARVGVWGGHAVANAALEDVKPDYRSIRSGETYTQNHPGLIFPTDELRVLDARAERHSGFTPFDWEYTRNDHRLGVSTGREDDLYRLSRVVIEQREILRENNGRPSVSGSFRIYSIEAGPGR